MSPSLGDSLDGHQTVRVAGLAAVGFLVWVARGNRALRFVSDVKNRAGVGGAPKLVKTRLDVAEPEVWLSIHFYHCVEQEMVRTGVKP